jgi:hypothetical protein
MPLTFSRYGGGIGLLEDLALDPLEVHLDAVGDAPMHQGLDQALVGVLEPRVLTHDGDGHLALGILHAADDVFPGREVGLRRVRDAEGGEHLGVEPLGVVGERHLVDRGHVARLNHRRLADIAEQGQLAPLLARDRPVAAAEQDVGLDADGAQLGDRVLGGLGLQLAGGGDEGQKRQVDVDGVAAGQLVAELADRLEEGQALDVAHRAADLDEDEVVALVAGEHEVLDGVRHVRDHLDRRAEIVPAPLLGDDVLVDPPGGDVVLLRRRHAGEALVMAEVEIGLGAVVGDEDLAVLVRAHRARVDVEVGVELAQPNLVAARLQHRPEGRRGEALAER